MPTTPSFRPGSTAAEAHHALHTSLRILDQAQHCAVLWFGEIMRRRLHRELGFSSMRQYATEGLGFSPTRAGDFMRLAEKLESLPLVKAEVASGRLGYTKAREIVTVADPANEKAWVQVAHTKSRRALVEEVRQAKQLAVQQRKEQPGQGTLVPRPASNPLAAPVPTKVTFTLSPAQFARYEAMLGQIEPSADKAELLLDMMESHLAARENTPRGASHYQIHIHECPSCARATVASPRGETELSASEAEAAHCDAQLNQPGARQTSTIPPRVRREVLARDRHQCRRKGCSHTRFLHLHHLVPRADGGTHKPENLVTLCGACHQLWHERGGDLRALLREVPLVPVVSAPGRPPVA
jgi:hypothetical protein